MEDKDHLKEVLGPLDQIHDPINLESHILEVIEQQERSKNLIARYKANGFKALILSISLIVILGILLSIPRSTPFIGYTLITYGSISLALLTLFVQLEMGKRKIFNHL